MANFPTLYKLNKNGTKWQTWHVCIIDCMDLVEGFIIRRTYGLEGGKMTISDKKVKQGKNIGKANETTPYQQAVNEATTLFNNYKDVHNYSEKKQTVKNEFPGAMLAQSFNKKSKRIIFPAFVQPKLDGVRFIVSLYNSTVTCYSRTGKVFGSNALSNIRNHIKHLLEKCPILSEYFMDGELYSNDLTFEEISGICRNTTNPTPEIYEKLEFHVYDLIPIHKKDMHYMDRLKMLKEIFRNVLQNSFLKMVPSVIVNTVDDIYEQHGNFTSLGYEGTMIRNQSGAYSHNRTDNLQKLKDFEENEFLIVDVKEATGNDEGTAIVQCRTSNGNGELFWVRPKGSRAYRSDLLTSQIKDRFMTVRYQNLTEKGVPRFPVGIAIRDYE